MATSGTAAPASPQKMQVSGRLRSKVSEEAPGRERRAAARRGRGAGAGLAAGGWRSAGGLTSFCRGSCG